MSTINQKVIIWARSRLGQQVGIGECWDLANQALLSAGAASSATDGSDADYVWGDEVDLEEVIPGDILQFRDYVVTTTTTVSVTFADQSESEDTTEATVERPHHTAVVDSTPGAGWLSILEQNMPPLGKRVQKHKLALRSMDLPNKTERKSVKSESGKWQPATVVTKVAITVSGTIWAYRPKANE